MERERYESLNGLRAIAAICILLMHYYLNLSEETKTVLSDSSFLYGTVLTSIGAIVRGTLAEVISHFTVTEPKGEIVIVLAGKGKEKKLKTK